MKLNTIESIKDGTQKFKDIEVKLKLEEEIIFTSIEKDPENIKICE